MSDRFYVNLPLRTGPVTVEGAEAHHLATVRRFRPGDRVCLFNGDGKEYRAEITGATRHKVELEITGVEAPTRELGFRLELAAPLPKGDRGQFLLEKLTELGVTAFIPLRTQRSVVHPGEARVAKMQRHVVEACKQCGRNVLMHIAPLTDWEAYCGRNDLPATRLLAHLWRKAEGRTQKAEGSGASEDICPPPTAFCSLPSFSPGLEGLALAVGPEGGFSQEEVDLAEGHGWRRVDLGPRTLRIETAAMVLVVWSSLLALPK